MSETIETTDDGFEIWPWYNIMHDLKEQGHIEVVIDPLTVHPNGSCQGKIGEIRFRITWVYGKFLLLTAPVYSQPLVDAFTAVVGYKPFCQYQRNDMVTVEWDKTDPIGRFIELQKKAAVSNLIMFEDEGGLEH